MRALVVLCSLVTFLAAPASAALAAPAARRVKGRPAKAPLSVDRRPLIQGFTAVESGPGVLIFEPSGRAAPDLLHFGAGCGRWLHLVVGGQPEFGKTPLWVSVDEARRNLKLPSLALPLADAARVARSLGCTHVGVGEVRGDLSRCTLTYRLYAVHPQAPVGAPLSVSGSGEEITARLPELARQLAERLGARTPNVPDQVGETAAELEQIGGMPWEPGNELDEAKLHVLNQLAATAFPSREGPKRPGQPVLGALLDALFFSTTDKEDRTQELAAIVAHNLPGNALALAEATRVWLQGEAKHVEQLPTAELAALRATHPHSYLLNVAQVYCGRISGDLVNARTAAEEAIRCNRSNPRSWLCLYGVLSDQAEAVRHGRPVNTLSPEEFKTCAVLYAVQMMIATKAAKLAPEYCSAWISLSQAGASLGEEEVADRAYRKAEALEPRNASVLSWGMQLYQPKWLSQPARLKHVAILAVSAARTLGEDQCWDLALGLAQSGMVADAEKIVRRQGDREAIREYAENLKREAR